MTFSWLNFFVLIHCSVVVKTSDLSVQCLPLTLKWHEFNPYLIPFFRSDNFVCVCLFFLFGGGGDFLCEAPGNLCQFLKF